jgi:hypothetical protein
MKTQTLTANQVIRATRPQELTRLNWLAENLINQEAQETACASFHR